jgi:hypothetical protein
MKPASGWPRSGALGFASLTLGVFGTAIAAAVGCGSTQAAPADASTHPTVATETPAHKNPVSSSEGSSAATSKAPAAAGGERVQPAIATLLSDGFEARFPKRAKLFVGATAHTRPGEREPEAAPNTSEIDVSVVLETREPKASKDQVRVAIDTRTLRAALWMYPTALAPVLTQRSVFGSSATSAPRPRDPVGHPGLRVSVSEARNARVEVTATYEFASPDSGIIKLKGWIDEANTGVVYDPAPPDAVDAVAGEASFVDSEVDIRVALGGPSIAHVGTGGAGVFFPVKVLTRARGFAEIVVTASELELSGFVDQRVIEPLEPESARGWGRAHFNAKLWPRWPKEQVRIPGGTCIYDAPDGEVIGIVKRSHVNNVVVLSDTPHQRAYQLPYDAVGYLYAADLAPSDSRGDDAELTELEPAAWSCPKRSVSR